VDSYLHPDARVKLGRMTDWRPDVPGIAVASGQKLLAAGERDYPLLEVRSIGFAAREESDGVSSSGD
jgi:protein involved in temperature-dependent protein secretion